ncbi:EF-hand calcium-binding domain-containing protein 14 [Biomphalaria glabrata]|uniref:Thioredoxin domain-containing protein 5-like n=1 Tax=Biomphalaria glabrata TaxID=6526 RepID=A0A9W2ZA42_BIOGL|nr:thioredoxin domain-containing protein 5-like [Biomphalaria glabrata]KAI8730614.1 hypothetical protein BgiMline_030959 [Biomphalaria glabrata]
MAERVTMYVYMFVFSFLHLYLGQIGHAEETDKDPKEPTPAFVYNVETFEAALAKNRIFVMFHAPWCGHCKNLSPTWDELAKVYNQAEDSPLFIGKVDCTVHTALCADHEVVGFPTLKLFEAGGKAHKRYSGKRDLSSLKAFVQEQVLGLDEELKERDGPSQPVEEKSADEPAVASQVVSLDVDNFADTVAKGLFFIKFYAPWCTHCQTLAPVWEELAGSLSDNKNIVIAELDCTSSNLICKQFGVRGYPTLFWFKDGINTDQFQSPRTLENLKSFVQNKLSSELSLQHGEDDQKIPEEGNDVPDQVKDNPEGTVSDLKDETFKSQISTGLVFVKFFAPWCGHCKRLAPAWEDLAKLMAGQPVIIAKVDCTQHKAICDENEVRGYPTLKLFRDGQLVKEYRGGRTVEDLSSFVKKELEIHDEL